MEDSERPKPQKNFRQEELEDKIASLVAEALYEDIVKRRALLKERKKQGLK